MIRYEWPRDHEALYRRLTGQPAIVAPALGQVRVMPTEPLAPLEPRSQGIPEAIRPGWLWRVPDLPPHYLPRLEHIEPLIAALQTDGRAVGIAGIAGKHGVHGMGGIGKSVLSAAVARSPVIRSHFTDGIYWLDIGQEPQITSLQRWQWGRHRTRAARDIELRRTSEAAEGPCSPWALQPG